ncbi:MAG: M20/M25/M40 family metallo-hydrolase [Bacteroidota bacterium]
MKLLRYLFACLISLISGFPLYAQNKEVLDALVEAQSPTAYQLLRECLSIPNDAHFEEHIEMNVKWMEEEFGKRNFQTERLLTEGPPLLLASRKGSRSEKTVLIYLQIDGQPVDPAAWNQPDPWKPVLKEKQGDTWEIIDWKKLEKEINPDWRVFARAAADAKGPVVMFLSALDIAMKEGFNQAYDLKVIMDFEEELGSPHLPGAVLTYKDKLAADVLIIYDGPMHASKLPTLTFGARGISTITLKVFGPKRPQHSGHFGNYAPNPALRISQLLASMKDNEGRVIIPGYYEGIEISEAVRKAGAEVPDDEPALQRSIGISETDRVGANLQEAVLYPSLNIRGLSSGWVLEQKRTIVPSVAIAEIDIRLVPQSDPDYLVGLVKKHVENAGYYVIEEDRGPTDEERQTYGRIASFTFEHSYAAFRTPVSSPYAAWLSSALDRAHGKQIVKKPTSGGSIPISPFVVNLGLPAITVPTVNKDNNQHSPNENLRLGNFIDGIKTYLSVLTEEIK